jgi:hypothetical protein
MLTSLIRQVIVGVTAGAVTVSVGVGAHAALQAPAPSLPRPHAPAATLPTASPTSFVPMTATVPPTFVPTTTAITTTTTTTTLPAPRAVVDHPNPTANTRSQTPMQHARIAPPTTVLPHLPAVTLPSGAPSPSEQIATEFMELWQNGYAANVLAPFGTPTAVAQAESVDNSNASGTEFTGCDTAMGTTACQWTGPTLNFTVTVDDAEQLVVSFSAYAA